MSASCSAVTLTSLRSLPIWFGLPRSTFSNSSCASCTRSAVGRLALLVLARLRQRLLVDLGVLARGDERGHPAHRLRAAAVAGLDEELGVRSHERHRHGDLHAVGQHLVLAGPVLLDQREHVVPAARVEPAHVVAQLVEDLVHLERGGQRLDQHRRADGAARDLQRVLRQHEGVVPQARLEVALQLGQVEVRAGAAVELLARVVEERQSEVEQAPGDRLPVHQHVLLRQVPAARADQQRGDLLVQLVLLALGGAEREGAAHRLLEVLVADDDVAPGGRERVLEVRHEDVRAGVERVDHHLALDRPGDLHEALGQVLGDGGDLPVAVADLLRLGEEAELLSAIELALPLRAAGEELLAPRVQLAVQPLDQRQRLAREDGFRPGDLRTLHLDAHALLREAPSLAPGRTGRHHDKEINAEARRRGGNGVKNEILRASAPPR